MTSPHRPGTAKDNETMTQFEINKNAPIVMENRELSSVEIPPGISFAVDDGQELLRVSPEGFYVRGKLLEQDENEARAVFDAFTSWLSGMGILF